MSAAKAIMYGYRGGAEKETVGYLCVNGTGAELYSIVDDAKQATRFPKEYGGKWADFFNGEDDLRPWVFHPVYVNN